MTFPVSWKWRGGGVTVIDREDRCGRRYKQGYLYQNSDKCLFLDLLCNMLVSVRVRSVLSS